MNFFSGASRVARIRATLRLIGNPLRGCLCLALLSGCTTLPRGKPVELTHEQRAALRAFPEKPFEMEQSVVFTLRDRDFAGFGFTRIEPHEKKFTATCLSAQGMTIFELSGEGERLDICRTLPGAGEPEKVGAMFTEGIRNVYFGNTPDADAAWYDDGGCWVAVSMNGTLRHRFSSDGILLGKQRRTPRGKILWSISFSDYDEIGPRRIELRDNSQNFSYTLNLRVKTWRVAGEEP